MQVKHKRLSKNKNKNKKQSAKIQLYKCGVQNQRSALLFFLFKILCFNRLLCEVFQGML